MTHVDFTLASLEAAGALRPVDVALARALARLGPEGARDPAVVAAVALASSALAEGHVRLPLTAAPDLVGARTEGAATTTPPDDLAARLARSGLVAERPASPAGSPLVLDDGALYLRRYAEHERRIAEVVNRLADAAAAPGASTAPAARLDALFGEASREGRGHAQRRAAEVALERRLVLVSGGPGTGKTWTVARLLALQIEQATAAGRPAPAIVLAAPTGKAATRLEEAIAKERATLPVADPVRLALPSRARTLHRVLGSVGGSSTRFRHGEGAPLPADLVVVDEASMIDVGLFRRLLDALGPATRLVLLGDPDQLPSVEAGSVFADLTSAPAESAVGRCLVRLTESRRFDPASGVGRLADAIRRGDGEEVLATLRAGGDAVALEDAVPRDALGERLGDLAQQGFRGVLDPSETPATRLAALERFRVLAAHRGGPYGTKTLNTYLSALLLRGGRRRAHAEDGRVLLVTTNDYDTGLFNGDLGLACVHPQDTTRRLHAWFPALTGPEPRRVPPARLPAHETAFAMTVHKSQGSEADTVAVVLPDESSPLLGRELFYTAVTRARARVVVFGGEASVRRAVETRTERWSGLRARLA